MFYVFWNCKGGQNCKRTSLCVSWLNYDEFWQHGDVSVCVFFFLFWYMLISSSRSTSFIRLRISARSRAQEDCGRVRSKCERVQVEIHVCLVVGWADFFCCHILLFSNFRHLCGPPSRKPNLMSAIPANQTIQRWYSCASRSIADPKWSHIHVLGYWLTRHIVAFTQAHFSGEYTSWYLLTTTKA